VLCYRNIYEQTHKNGADRRGAGNLPGQAGEKDGAKKSESERERLKPKPMADSQAGMVAAFNRYICYIHPPAGDRTGQDQLVDVKYERARTYFEAQHWEEAAAGFREIVINHPQHVFGVYAAQLYLESINVLGSHFSKNACFGDMEQDVPTFVSLYCGKDTAQKNADACTSLNKIQVDLLRLKAQNLVASADRDGGREALASYEKAGAAYFEMFRRHCQEPADNGQAPQADRCDEIVYNAAKSFQAARLVAKAIGARKALLAYDDKLKLHSRLAVQATYEIGKNFQAIADYEQAAEWFERYAKASPDAPDADTALSDAVVLRLNLGQADQAIEDARVFTKNYGTKKPAQAGRIAFAVGDHYSEQGNPEKARDELSRQMSVIDKSALDVQLLAHATLGRAFARLANGKGRADENARREYGKVRALWADPAKAEAAIRAAYPNDDEVARTRKVAKALEAVGEAYFFAAEERRIAEVEPLKFPTYTGPGDKASVLRHVDTKVRDWLLKKRTAIEKVEPEYAKILGLKPEAPPRWVIAAGAQAGLLWGDFVDDFRKAPIPASWKQDAELRGVYYETIDAKSEPIKTGRAKPALKQCLDLSVKYQYFDEYSRKCELWLGKNYKSEYHVIDELRGAPTLSNGGLDEKSPPVFVDGTFWHPPTASAPKNTTTVTNEPESASAKSPAGKPTAAKPATTNNRGTSPSRKRK